MKTHRKEQPIQLNCFKVFFLGIVAFLAGNTACFATIAIHGNQIITTPTTYSNTDLDLTDGRFTINSGGSLTIQNSTINGTISSSNPFFVSVNGGSVNLTNNTVSVKASGITPDSSNRAQNQVIQVQQGNVNMVQNNFSVDTSFTVGLLATQSVATTDFKIDNNTISNFHGGLYLINSNNAEVNDNTFKNVSYSNIFNMGNLSKFNRNLISFPGNLTLGNAFDIINSDGVTIADNIIASGSNYGIFVMGGQNLFISNNKITDGLSYAIFIQTPSLLEASKNIYLSHLLASKKIRAGMNNNIVITNNYLAQNRFGLSGGMVNNLIVTDNTFIQHFTDSSTRQYWTNNDILLPSVTNLTWINNLYKEAFTQDNDGDNSPALQFVSFPAHGGVFIS